MLVNHGNNDKTNTVTTTTTTIGGKKTTKQNKNCGQHIRPLSATMGAGASSKGKKTRQGLLGAEFVPVAVSHWKKSTSASLKRLAIDEMVRIWSQLT
jgi:hypothetical protein